LRRVHVRKRLNNRGIVVIHDDRDVKAGLGDPRIDVAFECDGADRDERDTDASPGNDVERPTVLVGLVDGHERVVVDAVVVAEGTRRKLGGVEVRRR
jgi:hypothetical protein